MPYLQPRKDALEIDGHGQIPNLFFGVDGVGVGVVGDAGVVEQHVEAAISGFGLLDHALAVGGAGYVGRDGGGLPVVSGDGGSRFFSRGRVDVNGGNVRAFTGAVQRGLAADARACTGDEDDFVGELHDTVSRAASPTTSDSAGCAWTVRATSSALAPNSRAKTPSAIKCEACGPRMCIPKS